ncbi:TonB-dependent receptor [Chitinophaga nivalis]|uniref:TonB-dependent receptor n=1 Tax=Chitinophaga nivalis TaxID=2991709 RepID=A0ABT3IMQ0_9BACT|nr:TonB-dependent receptor [Chitinophaga nivalis]MCW3465073.1 TonB-dependent receptor [Chitinophaga nivalis]MCW3485235.1 TonB-dependent receptor [Chitinophaga nivalis]
MRMFLTAIMALCITNIYAQTIIKGSVKDPEGNLVPGASVTIGKNKATTTNDKGEYQFTDLQPGKYTVTFSFIGYETTGNTVHLKEGETRVVQVTLVAAAEQLQHVEIVGRKESGYRNTSSFIGTKTATPLKEVPQSISYVTKELMQDQQSLRVGEVVKNMSGVSQYTSYDDFIIRGFRTQNNGQVQLLNGLRTITGFWKQPLTNYLERVEVIKGPASVLFGNSSPGGIINRVTKKPLMEKRQSLSFSSGSFNTFRGFADFTGPMNTSKTLLYRLNLGYENAQSFRDLQFDKNFIVAPSISFLPNEKTRLNLDVVYNRSMSRLDRGQAVYGNNDIYSVPVSKSLNAANDYLNEDNVMITTSFSHQFNKHIQFNVAYLKTIWDEDLLEHRTANGYAKDSANRELPTLVEMQVLIRKRKVFSDNVSAYFTFDVNTGVIGHKIVTGYDYAQSKMPWGAAQSVANGYRNNTNTAAGAYNKDNPGKFLYETVNGVKRPVPNVPHFDLTSESPYQLFDMSKYFYTKSNYDATFYRTQGIYVQDQLTLGKFQALLGLRYDRYTDFLNYTKKAQQQVVQEALIPRIGLVYTMNRHVNLYATYTEGYNPQTASTINNPNAGGPFDPLLSNLIEAGAKSDWFNDRLSVTLSAYRIRLKNVLYKAGDAGNPDLMRQVGQVESKGIEMDVKGQLTPDWYLTAAYAFNESAIKESPKASEIGRQSPGAPKHQGSVWTKYSIRNGKLKGLGIGAGSNFVTERNVDGNDIQTLPAYTLVNAAIYYKIDRFQLQVNLNNIFNKTYWVGGYDYLRLFPGAPRNWLSTVSYVF